jgi:hypothetical protein
MQRKTVFIFISWIIAFSLPVLHSAAKPSTLDPNEETHLIFMREEEKLARDVYITLGQHYGKNPDLASPFSQIVPSEQNHTDVMEDKLRQYGIEDPNTDDTVGVFTGEDYGPYFTEKYNELVERGFISYLEALHVGAFIEELDMSDIVNCPEVIQLLKGISEDDCGMEYTNERRLIRSYDNLLEGSKNHLGAYVQAIEQIIGYGNYEAQYLTQEAVDDILGR